MLQANALIKYIQSMRGRRLWPAEDIGLDHRQQQLPSAEALASMVQHCLDAFDFEPGLKQTWVTVSLDWAVHARSRHLACRSQQVLRALQPQLTADMCSMLLLCVQQCLSVAEVSAAARDAALELLLTLRELLAALPARKLLLYPQVRVPTQCILQSLMARHVIDRSSARWKHGGVFTRSHRHQR